MASSLLPTPCSSTSSGGVRRPGSQGAPIAQSAMSRRWRRSADGRRRPVEHRTGPHQRDPRSPTVAQWADADRRSHELDGQTPDAHEPGRSRLGGRHGPVPAGLQAIRDDRRHRHLFRCRRAAMRHDGHIDVLPVAVATVSPGLHQPVSRAHARSRIADDRHQSPVGRAAQRSTPLQPDRYATSSSGTTGSPPMRPRVRRPACSDRWPTSSARSPHRSRCTPTRSSLG